KVSKLIANVKSGVGKKKVINVLMHDTGKSKRTTVEALPSIIEYLKKQGYSFEALTTESVLIQHKRK
ncbi:MAG: polysaccharide deacetylase, partial [Clostridia bacterium]|nr:polysaccharide deacetylase [Clostridia bacterium]